MRSKPFLWPSRRCLLPPVDFPGHFSHTLPWVGTLSHTRPWHWTQDKTPALPSTSTHMNPGHSTQFLVPYWLSLIVQVPGAPSFQSILFAVQTYCTYLCFLILAYSCLYEYFLYCYLHRKIREARGCFSHSQRARGHRVLNSTRGGVFPTPNIGTNHPNSVL